MDFPENKSDPATQGRIVLLLLAHHGTGLLTCAFPNRLPRLPVSGDPSGIWPDSCGHAAHIGRTWPQVRSQLRGSGGFAPPSRTSLVSIGNELYVCRSGNRWAYA